MEDKIFITHDEQNNVTGAFGFKPEVPFITVPSSVWQQFAIYKKEELKIIDTSIEVLDEGVNRVFTLNKTKKLLELKLIYEGSVKAMTGGTDPAEMASWMKQEAEARSWIANNAVVTPIIDNLIIGRAMGESKADLVVKIITKADAYTVAYAQVLGAYHAKQKAIEVATTVAEVEAI